MPLWLAEATPESATPELRLFASRTGTALNYANVHNRVLRPALIEAGIAVKVGEGCEGPPRVGLPRRHLSRVPRLPQSMRLAQEQKQSGRSWLG